MVAQTNDTDLHYHVRKRFIELQQDRMIRKARLAGGGLQDLDRKENIDIMIEAMSDTELHMRASRGYKYTGTMVALDGTEDDQIVREAGIFWRELHMRDEIDSAVAEIDAQYQAGNLPWTWAIVQSLITPFPHKRQLDVVLPGQEDEATEDPDGVLWELEDLEVAKEGEEDLEAENEEEEGEEFDPADWHENHMPGAGARPGSDSDALHGGGVGLSAEQSDVVIEQSERVRTLQEATRVIAGLEDSVGASLIATVKRVMHMETKRFNQRNKTDPAVRQELRSLLDAEEARIRRDRAALQEHMRQTREKDRVKRELTELAARLRKTRQQNREAEAVVAARAQIKAYSLESLGIGKKNGGGQQYHKTRMEVMERLRRVAKLSPQQTAHWDYFKSAWDKSMSHSCNQDWAVMFSQMMQQIVNDLTAGKLNALSEFMYNETKRSLLEVPALMVPGDGGQQPFHHGDVVVKKS